MASYFLDSSALIKRQVAETGHTWVQTLCQPRAGHTALMAEIALVEVIATFCRMVRETPPRLSLSNRDRPIARFQQQARRRYVVVLINRAVLTRATVLCRAYPLRAYDAVQFACALTTRDDNRATGLLAPIFVCADTTLLQAAAAEGLSIENPNLHP